MLFDPNSKCIHYFWVSLYIYLIWNRCGLFQSFNLLFVMNIWFVDYKGNVLLRFLTTFIAESFYHLKILISWTACFNLSSTTLQSHFILSTFVIFIFIEQNNCFNIYNDEHLVCGLIGHWLFRILNHLHCILFWFNYRGWCISS